MPLDEKLEQQLLQLGVAIAPRHSVVVEVMARTAGRTVPPAAPRFSIQPRTLLRFPRLAASMAAMMVVFLVSALFLLDTPSSPVLASEVLAALGQSRADGLTARERTIVVLPDGSRHTSSTWNVLYVGRDSYRRDFYETDKPPDRPLRLAPNRSRNRRAIHGDSQPREMQWYTPQGEAMLQTSVRFDTKTYTLQTHRGAFGDEHPVARMSFIVRFIDDADRRLAPMVIRGRQCPGFEIRSSKYGDNPSEWIDRIWLDPETKLPARIERERPGIGGEVKALITVQEQFDWHPDLPADTFTPKLPEEFTLQ